MKKLVTIGTLWPMLSLMIVVGGHAQRYPDTLWMPVTFYDYTTKGDPNNPNFEEPYHGLQKGMVQDTLSKWRKPLFKADLDNNDRVEEWYFPSGLGIDTAYNYTTNRWEAGVEEWDPVEHPQEYRGINYDDDYDMRCIVIYDSLPFIHINGGVYQFEDQSFFPLDDQGYGNEGRSHNYGFAMELHTTFTKKEGITFHFTGDDDVWAFIDGNLEMDIGGVHSAISDSFNVDDLELENGKEYDFDFFFAERHTTQSHIWITTNIVSTHIINEVTIEADPEDATIIAGDSVNFTGTVWYDSTGDDGVRHHLPDSELSSQITWSFEGNHSHAELTSSTGSQTSFTATGAYEDYVVTATYEDQISGSIVSAQMHVTVLPDVPDHLVLEETYDTSISLEKKQYDQPIDTVVIGSSVSSENVYAIIRDRYGNFVDYSKRTTWAFDPDSVISSVTGEDGNVGRGRITKVGRSGYGQVTATDRDHSGDSYSDATVVRVLNAPPTANDDAYSVAEDQTLTVPSQQFAGVLDNDQDPDPSAILTVVLVDEVSVGALVLNPDGSFQYTPPSNYDGMAEFTYRVSDGELFSNVASVTITIGGINDPPSARADSYTVKEDAVLNVSAPGILENDNDIDGDELHVHIVAGIPAKEGSLAIDTLTGAFSFTPALNFYGTTGFSYQASDGSLRSSVVEVTIIVEPVNDPPVVADDSYRTDEDRTLSVSSGDGVIANDHDPDSTDNLTVSLEDSVAHGTLSLNADGSFQYVPESNYNGTDMFTYRLSDGTTDAANIGTVTITVKPVNDAPTVSKDLYHAREDVVLTVGAPGVLSNDTDVDGDDLTAVLVTGIDASDGTLDFNSDGSFEYRPSKNFFGSVVFTYRATDGAANSAVANVMILVAQGNDKPTANDDAYGTSQDSVLIVSAPGVLGNDYDLDEDVLGAQLLSDIPAGTGTLAMSEDGSFTYTPSSGFTGTISFRYIVDDGNGSESLFDTATVTITVTPAAVTNDPPTAYADTFEVVEDTPFTTTAPGVLENDIDEDPESLRAILVDSLPVSKGTLVFGTDGGLSYDPPPDFNGVVSFTYQADDGTLRSSPVRVVLRVKAVNDAPRAGDDSYTTIEDHPLKIPAPGLPGLLANDSDPERSELSVRLHQDVPSASGSLDLASSGSFVYTPANNFNGETSFEYVVSDGELESSPATVTITVTAVNDTPTVAPIPPQIVKKGTPFSPLDLDEYVFDPDDSNEQIEWVLDETDNLTGSIDPVEHILSIAPSDSQWLGADTVMVTARDRAGAQHTVPIIFIVVPGDILNSPVTDTAEGVVYGNSLAINLRVPGSSTATIYYTYTTDGNRPGSPNPENADKLNGAGLVDFGSFEKDSVRVRIAAFAEEYPLESSEIATFDYRLIFPTLPAPTASPAPGEYEETDLDIALSVPGHADARILFDTVSTADPSSPTTSSLGASGSIGLGPVSGAASITISAYAEKDGWKPSRSTLVYDLNPNNLPRPVADPKGQVFSSDSLVVTLSVPGNDEITIRYTTDGSIPDTTDPVYTEPIVVTDSMTLRAVAVKKGSLPGPVMTEVYVKSVPARMDIYAGVDDIEPYKHAEQCTAGVVFPMTARIYDQRGERLRIHESDTAPITWKITELTEDQSGELSDSSGYSTAYSPRKAYNQVRVVASFESGRFVLNDTLLLSIKPGPAYRLWIEADQGKDFSPNEPQPLETVQLSSAKQTDTVYAVLRDSLGNYVGSSRSTIWGPSSSPIATAGISAGRIGQGVIYKESEGGTVQVFASNTALPLPFPRDSVSVTVLDYWFDALRIVTGDRDDGAVDSITMNTNQDTSVQVYGRRDDNGRWVKVPARWEIIDQGLKYIISSPPTSAHEWILSPNDTAQGRIRVTMGDDAVVEPDTAVVVFLPGPPYRIEFEVLTPRDSIRAGQPIRTVVHLYNQDNKPVYGTWCYPDGNGSDSAKYSDEIGAGGRMPPFIIIDSTKRAFDEDGILVAQCFGKEGGDSVDFILHYAPESPDSLHRISVDLGGIAGSTPPFRLLPGTVDSIDILVDEKSVDEAVLTYNSGTVLKLIGYDKYGNYVGRVDGLWNTTGNIPELVKTMGSQIYYEIPSLLRDADGHIYARKINCVPNSSVCDTIVDSVHVTIIPKPGSLSEVTTLDHDADGYLDALRLRFDKPVVLPATLYDSAASNHHFTVMYDSKYGPVEFTVAGVEGTPGMKDSVFILRLNQNMEYDIPQTDWQPEITIRDLGDGIQDVVEPAIAKDGAGPVIWSVTRIASSGGDRKKDVIVVAFSEEIKRADGSPFGYGSHPEDVFNVWADSSGRRVPANDLLKGIREFSYISRDSVRFHMTNGEELTSNHRLSINTEKADIADAGSSRNAPSSKNQPVVVDVLGTVGSIKVGPNPVRPTFNHQTDRLEVENPAEALSWIRHDGGAVFVTDFVVPSKVDGRGGIRTMQVTGTMLIFDAIGNLVYTRENRDNLIPDGMRSAWDPGETHQLLFYWNGITDANRAAAPGVYRVMLYLNFGGDVRKFRGNLGIAR